MDAVANEQQRQVWLDALGLTPWVASCHVITAPEANFLTLPSNKPAQETLATTSPVTPKVTVVDTAPLPSSRLTAAPEKIEQSQAKAPDYALPKPVVCLVGNTLLIAEQADSGAPDLGREEQQLLHSLLHIFGDQHKRFPFICPISAKDARAAFTTFIEALAKNQCQKVLLCLSDNGIKHLFGELTRYSVIKQNGVSLLAVSSFADMLNNPIEHKRKSWLAMQEAGFDH